MRVLRTALITGVAWLLAAPPTLANDTAAAMSRASRLILLVVAFLFTAADSRAADSVNVPTDVLEQFRALPPSNAAAANSTATLDGTKYSVIAPVSTGTDGNVSFIRLSNFQGISGLNASKTTTFAITVLGSPSGNAYGTANIQVPPLASPQYALSDILATANAGPLTGGDTGYVLYLQDSDAAGYQHVIYNANNGFFEDVSVCTNAGYENSQGGSAEILTNVHTSLLASYPSNVVIHNFGPATTYKVTVIDAKTGTVIGTVNLDTAANAYYGMPETFFEQQLKWSPGSNQQHVNLLFQDINNPDAANALVEQFIFNQALSAYINMSVGCRSAKSSSSSSTYTLTLTRSGAGIGSITSTPSGINCIGCDTGIGQFSPGTSVTLTATPNSGSSFQGWSGACTGTGTCTVTMTGDQNVTATFVKNYTLSVTATRGSSGSAATVASSPAGLNLCITCTNASATFAPGTTVTLTATPLSGVTFLGWGGACSGTGTCTVTMNSNQAVTTSFSGTTDVQYQVNLAVTYKNGASGSVSSATGAFTCTGSATTGCSTKTASYSAGTNIVLSATPASGSTFQGWGGACSGTGTCPLTLASNQTVTATFDTPTASSSYPLTLLVTNSSGGGGTVTSSPSGINCTGTCTTATSSFASGSGVTLTATPASGSTFTGWSGACSGTGTCTVTMTAAQNVGATFTGPSTNYTLNLTSSYASGSNGSVTSSPAGISCTGPAATGCVTNAATFNPGTIVTLTATPTSGSVFQGWGGACSGTGTCTVTMNANQSVTASFAAGSGTNAYSLSLTSSYANGSNGSVTSSPAGISCTGPATTGCVTNAATFNAGTTVTLTAAPASGSTFQGWGGACSGTGACTVTMNANQSVTAAFATGATVSSSTTYSYTGNIFNDNSSPYTATFGLTHISGSFTVNSPLPANSTRTFFASGSTDSTVTAYAFTDGVSTWNLANSASSMPTFSVTTDASGNITAWNIRLSGGNTYSAYMSSCTACATAPNVVARGPSEDMVSYLLSPGNGLPSGEYQAGVFTRGTWTRTSN